MSQTCPKISYGSNLKNFQKGSFFGTPYTVFSETKRDGPSPRLIPRWKSFQSCFFQQLSNSLIMQQFTFHFHVFQHSTWSVLNVSFLLHYLYWVTLICGNNVSGVLKKGRICQKVIIRILFWSQVLENVESTETHL